MQLGNPTNLPDDHAAKVVGAIREIVRAGTLSVSVHKIASAIKDRGVATRRGGQLSGTLILNTIRRCGFQPVSEVVVSA